MAKKVKEPSLDFTEQQRWLPLLLEFIQNLTVDSKETGVGPLNLYGSQMRFLAELVEGLERDVHTFINLKAMQLGISTLTLAVDLFWLAVHPGMQGVLVTDTDGNRQKFRVILKRFLSSLPRSYAIKIAKGGDNREHMVFDNGSVLDFVVAGTRTTATEVGRSRAYNFAHLTEVANYGTIEGVVSLIDRLAEKHPNRLYMMESTAKGYNLFYKLWQQARQNPESQKAFFIGWWAKDDYCLDESSHLFAKYWDGTVDDQEQQRVNTVWEKYGVRITPGQIAWYRWKSDVSAENSLMDQNFPWDEDDAFLNTGQSFFSVKPAVSLIKNLADNPPPMLGYAYAFSEQFMETKITPVNHADDAMLKIYEEPSELGSYAMGVDPAYGRSKNMDASVIQICRCYSDRLVQVAEFATPVIENHQVAWVMAHLAGIFKNIMVVIEITGPGDATVREISHLRQLYDAGALPAPGNGEIGDIFGNARWFMYHRVDSPGAGFVYHWKALSLETRLPTPTGWTTMGRAKFGDYLMDDQGKPTRVIGLSPIFFDRPCYSVNFDDGTSIVADADHLWSVTRNLAKIWNCGRAHRLRKTSELLPGKHIIEKALPFDLPEQNLPIDPYILGAWLGDGLSAGAKIYAHRKDISEISATLKQSGAVLGPINHRLGVSDRIIKGLHKALAENGLINNKHIPSQYLRGSFGQRLALLQGLMDTDGSASKSTGRFCDFTTSNGKLAVGFSELLRTLGFKAKFSTRYRTLQYKGTERACATAYQFYFIASNEFPVFRMRRKQNLIDAVKTQKRNKRHRIVSVEPVKSVAVRCVMVDSPTHLYLAGEGMVPTHNTNLDNKTSILTELSDSFTTGALQVNSIQAALEMQSIVRRGFVIEPSLDDQKDDRVLGLAFAHRAWVEWIRPGMIADNDTYARVCEQEANSEKGDHDSMVSHIVTSFFEGKDQDREDQELEDSWK